MTVVLMHPLAVAAGLEELEAFNLGTLPADALLIALKILGAATLHGIGVPVRTCKQAALLDVARIQDALRLALADPDAGVYAGAHVHDARAVLHGAVRALGARAGELAACTEARALRAILEQNPKNRGVG